MPRQARESSGTGFTAPVGEIDWDWEKHDISYVTKQLPVSVFLKRPLSKLMQDVFKSCEV